MIKSILRFSSLVVLSFCIAGVVGAQDSEQDMPRKEPLAVGDAAPELSADKGIWVNREMEVGIPSVSDQLTMVVFETVW